MAKLEYIKCAICDENNESLLIKVKNTHGTSYISDEEFDLAQCKKCGLVYINPRPINKEIHKYYSDNYYSPKSNIKSKIEKLVLQPYYMFLRKTYIEQFLKKGKILDIGCGSGGFINSLSKNNWEIYGIEPNQTGFALSSAILHKKINLYNKPLSDCKFPDNYFDIITMWHVLEHIHKPNKELQEIKRVLKDNGILIIAVPNIKSFGFKISKKHWFHLDAPRHLYHYDSTTIKKILNHNKFEVINTAFSFTEYPLDLYHSLMNSINISKYKFIKVLFMPLIFIFSLLLKLFGPLFKSSEVMTIISKTRKGD
ncbi:MAG: class I SAM-dependent methyltransferase [Candidatus Acididesulfobacter diazotrophicus]|jgi:ubiquinone/menaquinone biosynthesis C-methylase UbiE|uniref:Class I SAM-dependent methyltransferase n=1 Tax=Candidatus Acididesulfobacter diazotrophicus TaxID=2597226 RepID=A0A519BQ18_9DELT|nr:MAG: class I SAM-dependent methyltransferase [Candidatus Acididesulfobacter diazotrophicus]